jgi:hypothetical protein
MVTLGPNEVAMMTSAAKTGIAHVRKEAKGKA